MGSSKRDNKVLQTYQWLKDEYFDFERIGSFFNSNDKSEYRQVISGNTCHDLDFEELFQLLDRTCSKVGQQYLYNTLRTIPDNDNRAENREEILDFLANNPDLKEQVVLELNKLSSPSAFYLQSLIYGKHLPKPKWFWAIKMLFVLSPASIIATFFHPAFFLLTLLIFAVNFAIHIWNRNNVRQYSNAIPQLLILLKTASHLKQIAIPNSHNDEFDESIKSISKIRSKATWFKLDAQLNSDIGQAADAFMDLFKVLFILEPILLFKILEDLESKKRAIKILFSVVGEVDTAISVGSYRKTLKNYCKPIYNNHDKSISCQEVYHPMIIDPVSNSIDINDDKSILISGSNMSGKTTFIRTIGINCLLAQTINTALAKSFTIPRIDIYSAIRISDDLMEDKSYYQKEVLAIKQMIEVSETGRQSLFMLDELFKGTNTIERIAAGKAVLSYLNSGNNLVFASTHDLELTEFLSDSFSFYHFTEIIEDNSLSFDYQLKKGKLVKTNAIRVLEIYDYPESLIAEAKEISGKMFRNY